MCCRVSGTSPATRYIRHSKRLCEQNSSKTCNSTMNHTSNPRSRLLHLKIRSLTVAWQILGLCALHPIKLNLYSWQWRQHHSCSAIHQTRYFGSDQTLLHDRPKMGCPNVCRLSSFDSSTVLQWISMLFISQLLLVPKMMAHASAATRVGMGLSWIANRDQLLGQCCC